MRPATPPAEHRSHANSVRILRLFAPYRIRLAFVVALIFVTSVLGAVPAFLVREIFDVALPNGDVALLDLLVGGIIGIAVATTALGVAQTYLSGQVGQLVMHDLRTAVFGHLQRVSLAFFTRTRAGEIQSRLANDISGIREIVTSTATVVASGVTSILATVVAMVVLDWRLTIVALSLVPLFVWLTIRVGNERRRLAELTQASLADMSSSVQESLSVSGMLLQKTIGGSEIVGRRFRTQSARVSELDLRGQMAGRWVMSAIQMSFIAMPALVYLAAGHFATTTSLGTVVAFTTLQTRLVFPVTSVLGVTADVRASFALFDRIFEYLDLELDIQEGSRRLARCRGELAFEGVSFRYEDGADWNLCNVAFVARPGTKTAVVGPTGSGKTTIAYLAARLYDATEGRVTIDGVDVRDLTFDTITRTVGIVSQDTFLLHASVRNNLAYARPSASAAEIEEAAKAAQIHALIEALPHGYDTIVGEHGYRFSGGERQRIAIARTILRDPAILVFDEATSALDTSTERALQRAIERVSSDRTTIVIAHRLSTIRDADQILVLKAGRLVEAGTHEELLARNGSYASLLVADVAKRDEDVV